MRNTGRHFLKTGIGYSQRKTHEMPKYNQPSQERAPKISFELVHEQAIFGQNELDWEVIATEEQ